MEIFLSPSASGLRSVFPESASNSGRNLLGTGPRCYPTTGLEQTHDEKASPRGRLVTEKAAGGQGGSQEGRGSGQAEELRDGTEGKDGQRHRAKGLCVMGTGPRPPAKPFPVHLAEGTPRVPGTAGAEKNPLSARGRSHPSACWRNTDDPDGSRRAVGAQGPAGASGGDSRRWPG